MLMRTTGRETALQLDRTDDKEKGRVRGNRSLGQTTGSQIFYKAREIRQRRVEGRR